MRLRGAYSLVELSCSGWRDNMKFFRKVVRRVEAIAASVPDSGRCGVLCLLSRALALRTGMRRREG